MVWVLGRSRGNISFYYWFQGRNSVIHWWVIKISKRVWGYQKEGGSNINGGVFFFFFHQSKLMSHFVPVIPVSPDTTLKEICLR